MSVIIDFAAAFQQQQQPPHLHSRRGFTAQHHYAITLCCY